MRVSVVLLCLLPACFGYGGVPPRDQGRKDCVVKYSDWTDCSKPCGDGKQSRTATVLKAPARGGKPCPPLTEVRHCNSFPCTTTAAITTPADVPKTTTTKYYATTTKNTPQPSDTPPIMCSMLPDGNYPSGKCERIYFTCASQTLKTQSCPPGQIYDPANDWCDVPSNTETCTGTPPTPQPTEIPLSTIKPEVDAHFNCKGKDNGNYPDQELPCSNIFYTCSNGVTSRRKCPSNLWFDPELLVCDSFQRVPICSGKPRPVETEATTLPTVPTTLPPFDCTGKSGNQPDPTHSCSHVYYACHAGITDTFLCPEDLFYDASRDMCDHKDYIVACGGQPFQPNTTQQAETLPHVSFDCWGKADGFYSDPDNKCSEKYFACSGMLAREFHCQTGLIYSETLIACAHPDETYECTGTSPVPTTTVEFIPSTTEAVPFDCSQVGNGFFNDPVKKCSEIYYTCSGGIAKLLKCPSGTFYDAESARCDFYEDIYDCSGQRKTTVITEPTTEAPTTVPEYDCSKLSDGLYPIPSEKCSREFFSCSNGYTNKNKCPASLYFDPEFSVCDSYGNIFACTGQPKRTTTPRTTTVRDSVTTEKLPFDCTDQPDGEYADPLDKCSGTFYVCSNGITFKQICPPQLYFDKTIRVCADYLDVLDCAGKTRPPTTYKVTTPQPLPKEVSIDCKDKANGDYPNPDASCSQTFYTCSNGQGFERSCPFDLYFDVSVGICDVYANVQACSGNSRTTPESTTTQIYITTPSPYDCSSRANGNYPAGDCEDYFWVCVGGHSSRQECPRGLRFDAELNLCNYGEYMPTCGGVRETTTVEEVTSTLNPPSYPVDCSKLADGNVADPNSQCSETFYMCANGVTFEQKCPPGLRYHLEKDECGHLSEIPACAGVIPNTP